MKFQSTYSPSQIHSSGCKGSLALEGDTRTTLFCMARQDGPPATRSSGRQLAAALTYEPFADKIYAIMRVPVH